MGEYKVAMHKNICSLLNETYEKKNKDYGDSFSKSFEKYGCTMASIRLNDKLSRFDNLTLNKVNQEVNDESVEDTLLDLANYAIMTVMEMRLTRKDVKLYESDLSIAHTEPDRGSV